MKLREREEDEEKEEGRGRNEGRKDERMKREVDAQIFRML